jgi:hypothetical protein
VLFVLFYQSTALDSIPFELGYCSLFILEFPVTCVVTGRKDTLAKNFTSLLHRNWRKNLFIPQEIMTISNMEFQRLHQFLYLETSSKIPVAVVLNFERMLIALNIHKLSHKALCLRVG